MKKIYVLVLILMNLFYAASAQVNADSLQQWMSKFSMLSTLQVSENGKYAFVNKPYKQNTDTVLVFATDKGSRPVDTLVNKKLLTMFLGNHHLFAVGMGNAEVLDLGKHSRTTFNQIWKANVLKGKKQYFFMDREKKLSIYNLNGDRLVNIAGVGDFVTDSEKKLFIFRKAEQGYEVLEWNGIEMLSRYSSPTAIKKIELLLSGRYLVVTVTAGGLNTSRVLLISTATGKLMGPENLTVEAADYINVKEVGNGEAFLFDFEKMIPPLEKQQPKIWQGNDKTLRDGKYGSRKHTYCLWKPGNTYAEDIPTGNFSVFVPFNNTRYLWAFSTAEQYNYVMGTSADVYLYDIVNKTSTLVFKSTNLVNSSADGRYTVAYNEREKAWRLFDLQTKKQVVIPGNSRPLPLFTEKNEALFGGADGLWLYTMESKKRIAMGMNAKLEVNIEKFREVSSFHQQGMRFITAEVDLRQPVPVKLNDRERNQISYAFLEKDQLKTIIPFTEDMVKLYKLAAGKVFSIEESFNRPSGLWVRDLKIKKKQLLYQVNGHDKSALSLKRDVVDVTTSIGTRLKAVLYYPTGFDPAKKYPMVVRVYERQSAGQSVYPVPDYDEDGFNRRLLLEQGYFVYQPDVVFDKRGTGVAALDCVNSALDVIAQHPNINQLKIGLTGHSMGGYETNYIATQSSRFAGYVSGASVSNLLRHYFNFSDHFQIADYSRMESGQYAIGIPFIENKELYFKNTPIHYVENVKAPMLLWTGMNDTNVTPDQSMGFFMGLMRNNKPVVMLQYKDQGHDLGRGSKESKDLNIRTLEWWGYFLKDKKGVDWIDQEMKRNAD